VSIETTRDEPTMTILENMEVEPGVVKDFPRSRRSRRRASSNRRCADSSKISTPASGN